MAKGATFCSDLLKLIFNATPIANLADNAASSPFTHIYLSLHSGDPSGGDQTTLEVTYTGYTRETTNRNSTDWIVTGNSVSPAATITFPSGTGGGGVASHWGAGTASSGAGKLLYSGPLNFLYTLGSGIAPPLSSGSSFTEG